jgi:antitoxin YefM
MAIDTTYTQARAEFAQLLDRVAEDHEVVTIRRRGRPRVAMVNADELASLMETAHLLRSPRNATRLLAALRRALRGSGRRGTVASLRRELGLGEKA